MVGNARLVESDLHNISSKTPAPQYQLIDRRERKNSKTTKRERAASTNKLALALLLKPSSPTPSITGSRSFHRDAVRKNKSPVVLRGHAARRSISIPIWDQRTACNPH